MAINPNVTVTAPYTPRGFSVDRPRWRAIVLSAQGHPPQDVESIESFTTSKTDDSDAGTFALTLPLMDNVALSQTVHAMDLVAIFADRSTVDDAGHAEDHTQIGPTAAVSSLTYGSDFAAVTKLLGDDPTCIMIGLIDRPSTGFEMSEEPGVFLRISGRDLTKIFIDNDTDVPFNAVGSIGWGNLTMVTLARDTSGADLLLRALDVTVSKNFNAPGVLGGLPNVPGLVPAGTFGYPWRRLVRVDGLDPNFKSLGGNTYPPFSIQEGSAWANVMELKNAPACRLFVNERGQIIFDDAYQAWTGLKPPTSVDPVTGLATSAAVASGGGSVIVIHPEDVRAVDFYEDDSSIIGFLSIQPFTADVNVSLGQQIRVGIQPKMQPTLVQIYGFRQASFRSYYDIDPQTADLRAPTLWMYYNDIHHCDITVRGGPQFKVGMRYKLAGMGGASPFTQNAVWYCQSVTHEATFGSDWRATMHLRFPRAS